MTEEFSAGGIVFKKDGNNLLILVSQHSGHHGWVFPKGHVNNKGKDETPEEAAIREVEEETGVRAEIQKVLTPTTYWYQFQSEKRHKTVQYFLMKYVSGNIQNHDFEMEKVEWLPENDVENRLTYQSDKKVWIEAKRLLKTHL